MTRKEVDLDDLKEQIIEAGVLDPDSYYDEDEAVRELMLYGSSSGWNHPPESFEHIQKEGGGEGGGEHVETVFKFKDKIYKVVLTYFSYDGYQWDYAAAYEVQPIERLVTFYE